MTVLLIKINENACFININVAHNVALLSKYRVTFCKLCRSTAIKTAYAQVAFSGAILIAGSLLNRE